jgi:hypothetical protein
MEKEQLRPIQYQFKSKACKGYFHKWIISKYSDNGEEYALALIETEAGDVIQIETANGYLKFLDR